MITRETVKEELQAYLNHQIALAQLVDWAEGALMDAEFEEREAGVLRDIIARLGLADVREFSLSWEDCSEMLARLGYVVQVNTVAV